MFSSDALAIGHGANCMGKMGVGIAKEFRERYPEMYYNYQSKCNAGLVIPGTSDLYYSRKEERWIINLYTQQYPGANAKLSYIRSAIRDASGQLYFKGVRTLAIPKIGSGIGGLDWEAVSSVINTLRTGVNIEVRYI